ncbi:MAG: NYN domain-containing protein [Gemmatimonadaceae bacterium]
MAERCVMYVDGFNFYYAIKQRRNSTRIYLGWCDFRALAERELLPTGAALRTIRYFTAPVGRLGKSDGERDRQAIWLDAVGTIRGLEVIEGFHSGPGPEEALESEVSRKEKQTDVNIAVYMVVDAAKNACDRLVLIAGDHDQIPAVEVVTREFQKAVDVCLPPNHDMTSRWKQVAENRRVRVRHITPEMLQRTRLPDRIEDGNRAIEAPRMWRAPLR